MNGREKLLAAFTCEGTPEIGVVAAYENVFLRDHRAALTDVAWWDLSRPGDVAVDCHARSGLEWFTVHPCQSRTWNSRMRHEVRNDGVWIEECLTDQISPEMFRQINLPIVRRCVQEIRAQGMKSIYYFCGDPWGRLETILDAGADAVHFEESKKGFSVPIQDVAEAVDGRCVLFGNLDTIGVLQDGSEAMLHAEIRRQLAAASRNGNRFIMSTGSPITPGTTLPRVRRYTDMVRELAG